MLQFRSAGRPRADQLLERSELHHDHEPKCLLPFTSSDMQIDVLGTAGRRLFGEQLQHEVNGFQANFNTLHCTCELENLIWDCYLSSSVFHDLYKTSFYLNASLIVDI